MDKQFIDALFDGLREIDDIAYGLSDLASALCRVGHDKPADEVGFSVQRVRQITHKLRGDCGFCCNQAAKNSEKHTGELVLSVLDFLTADRAQQ